MYQSQLTFSLCGEKAEEIKEVKEKEAHCANFPNVNEND